MSGLALRLCAAIAPRDLLLKALTGASEPGLLPRARQVLGESVRCATRASRAPVAAVLAVCSWVDGDGAAARVALDVSLRADPAYSLAVLVSAALDHGVPPWDWVAIMSDLEVDEIVSAAGGDGGRPARPGSDDGGRPPTPP